VQACHHCHEGGRIACLSGGEMQDQRPAAAVGGKVDLRGLSAVGPADGMVVRLAAGPLLRAEAACW